MTLARSVADVLADHVTFEVESISLYRQAMPVNGNKWAKRQAAKAGIGFEALDNGFAAVEDVEGLQRICDSLGPEHIEALLRKWLAILPHPFTPADEDAGYRYELSILQAEFSLTQMLDRAHLTA